MDKKLRKTLIKSQQTELDAVLMYNRLALRLPEEVRAEIKSLAADEGRHAAVLAHITGETMRPRKGLASAVSAMTKLLGAKFMLARIAAFEYSAFDTYQPLVDVYPEMASVQADERRHGDVVTSIRSRLYPHK